MIHVKPQDFAARFDGKRERPPRSDVPHVAFVLPTTAAVLAAVEAYVAQGHVRVIGESGTGVLRPADMLKQLRMTGAGCDLVVHTDQIVSQADASILVRTDASDLFFSPLEIILNDTHGYWLCVWTAAGFEHLPPRSSDPERVIRLLVRHLADAEALGSEWRMAATQALRTRENRRYNALRKVRFFRSAVINAHRAAPTSSSATALLAQADALDELVLRGFAA